MFNLATILTETARAVPGRPALVDGGTGLTYGELDTRASAVAGSLRALGLRPGDVVGLQVPNTVDFPAAWFGILRAGLVAVPCNVQLKRYELAQHLADAGARALITCAGAVREALPAAGSAGVRHVFVARDTPPCAPVPVGLPVPGACAELPRGTRPFAELLAYTGSVQTAPRAPEDTAAIVYTSGTTGRPKGAELTHLQLYLNADIPARVLGIRADDVLLAALPLFHVFGLSAILDTGVRAGCTLSLLSRFSVAGALTAIARDRVSIFDGVPTMFGALVAAPDLDSYDLSSLRLAVSGGAPLPAELLDRFEQRFGVEVLEAYGLTETAGAGIQNSVAPHRRLGSVGRPVWGTETQIWNERGERLPPGAIGEVVTRGYHVMKGYLNQPEATAEAFAGGWFHTGDLGHLDEEGFVYVVDRKKELIIRGGYNVYPREIEEVLYAHPAVAEAAVVGVPDRRLGEEVKAYVALKPDRTVTEQDLIAHCRNRVAAYKYPRTVEFRQTLPKNDTGKIMKRALRG